MVREPPPSPAFPGRRPSAAPSSVARVSRVERPLAGWPPSRRGRSPRRRAGLLPLLTLTRATGQTLHSHVRVLPERAAEADGVMAGHVAGRQAHGAVLHRKCCRGGRAALGAGQAASPRCGPSPCRADALRPVREAWRQHSEAGRCLSVPRAPGSVRLAATAAHACLVKRSLWEPKKAIC